jgi:hypothetical protein
MAAARVASSMPVRLFALDSEPQRPA